MWEPCGHETSDSGFLAQVDAVPAESIWSTSGELWYGAMAVTVALVLLATVI